jgi:integrase
MEIEDAARSEVLRHGCLPSPSLGQTKKFFDLCEKYKPEIPERSKKVIESNLNILKGYFENRALAEFTPSLVAQFRTDMRDKKNLSVARCNHLLGTLKRTFRIASEQWQWLPTNTIQHVPMLPGMGKRIRILSEEEEKALIEHSPQWLQELIRFDLLTGMRLGECLKLNVRDIDFKSKLLTVWDTKNKEARTVPISQALEKFLQEKLKVVPISGILFPFKQGTVEWWVRRVCKEAGVSNFHFHDIRHCVVTKLFKARATPYEIMKFMNWKSPSMLNRYGHLQIDDIRSVGELLSAPVLENTIKEGSIE